MSIAKKVLMSVSVIACCISLTADEKADFKNPIGWSVGGKAVGAQFIPGDKGLKYLEISGDPDGKNNQWRYGWYPVKSFAAGEKLSFTASVKLEKLTSGRFDIGFYQFNKKGGYLAFTPVKVEPKEGWQEVSGTITVNQNAGQIMLYFLGRHMGKGECALVRSLEIKNEN